MRLARVVGFRGIDLDVHQGDIVLLRGSNGSGKTSLLRALAGLSAPIRPARLERDVPVAYSPQDARDALVGLTVTGEFRLRRRETPARLAPLAGRASTALSSGETRRVAHAVCEGARLLLLDEPSEGLDEEGRAALRALILQEAKQGAVVVADHGRAFDALVAEGAARVVHLQPPAEGPLPPMARGAPGEIVGAAPIVLRGRSLPAVSLGPGFHVVRGSNGAGKSTLLLRLAGLLDPQGVRIGGLPPAPGSNVRLLLPHAGDLLTRERVADECPDHALVPSSLRARHPLALSGGEAQRVALAKVLGAPADCYLLDEPEAHLDAAGRVLLVEAIAARVKAGACVLAATHDEAFANLAHSEVRL